MSASIRSPRRAKLFALLSSLDVSTARLSKILSSPAGIDKFLLTIYYTIKLLLPQLSRLRALNSSRLPSHIALPTSKIGAATIPSLVPSSAVAARRLESLQTSLRALSGLVSDFRTFSRLWGLLGIYRWARATLDSSCSGAVEDKDGAVRCLTWAQIGANTVYQALENVAFLGDKGVVRGVAPGTRARLWAWSCRFWWAHTLLEAAKLLRVRQIRLEARKVDATKGAGEKEGKIGRVAEDREWRRQWVVNAAYSPMAAHWSVESGLLSEEVVGALGVVVAWNSFGHMWRQTA